MTAEKSFEKSVEKHQFGDLWFYSNIFFTVEIQTLLQNPDIDALSPNFALLPC